jgi:hypothetical protein
MAYARDARRANQTANAGSKFAGTPLVLKADFARASLALMIGSE